jgi:hypothetical protein
LIGHQRRGFLSLSCGCVAGLKVTVRTSPRNRVVSYVKRMPASLISPMTLTVWLEVVGFSTSTEAVRSAES